MIWGADDIQLLGENMIDYASSYAKLYGTDVPTDTETAVPVAKDSKLTHAAVQDHTRQKDSFAF